VSSALPDRIAEVIALDPAADAVEFDGAWRSWGELAKTIDGVAAAVDEPGLQVGILLRNRPSCIGLLLGVLRAGGCVVTINPGRGRDRTRDDIDSLGLPVVAGEPDDLQAFVPEPGGTTTIAARDLGAELDVVRSNVDSASAHRAEKHPCVAVRMLTSGTTGPPKRIDLTYETLERVLLGNKHYGSTHETGAQLRRGVAIVNSPMVHLGGLFRVLTNVTDGRRFSLLEKFTVDGWVDAVRRHHPATASLVPTALRMVLESDADPANLESLRSVVCGTAPLDPDDADTFMEKYGVPVLISYAATEFGGAVAGWNVDDHRKFWASKRGSVGRAHTGSELRIVHPDTGESLPSDCEGLLEVRAGQLDSAEWLRTTDLARIDDDGFLYILGRADRAIIRGGFKVLPEHIKAALERHDAVRFAAVVGREDRRLGAVPVAAVELREGAAATTADDLLAYASSVLARYELPTEIRVVDQLPRTDAGKPDLGAVEALFEAP
jgi:acyl-CoA synthetase (AMP-forming)/AMP-acid ligase II